MGRKGAKGGCQFAVRESARMVAATRHRQSKRRPETRAVCGAADQCGPEVLRRCGLAAAATHRAHRGNHTRRGTRAGGDRCHLLGLRKKTAWGRHTLRCVPIGLRRAGVEGAPACVDPLHRVLRGVGGGVLFAADQGQAQRKHPSASGGLYRSHRLRLPDLKFAWRQHWLRECALQAHSRVRRADGWRGQWQFPPLPQSLRAGLPRSAPARRQDNAAG
mmetsp:Transcript_28269/g.71143  ORF Transcript_28269/g.71143 Transcript_28269/m.71143 type:complete len:218 (-) Transcript_28269:471-1124(-)